MNFQAFGPAALLKRGSNTVFSCEYWEIFKNNHFEEHLQTVSSEVRINQNETRESRCSVKKVSSNIY